jgi:long-chain acyl-CoA synthetase
VDQPTTLPQLFFTAVERFGTKRAALRHKVDGAWRDITHQDLARRVQHVALGIRELGMGAGDRIAILSENRPDWAIADYACLSIGCVDVAIYPTLPANQIAYLLQDSGSVGIFVSDLDMYKLVAKIAPEAPKLQHIISFDDLGPDVPALSMAALARHGAAAESKYADYHEEALAITPDTLATLIYTSGTTGPPKGVMLTHGNFTSNVLAALQVFSLGSDDACLSLLPLSHSFERTAGHYVMLHAGATINYAESIEDVARNMLEVRPTVMLSVPRLYEKIYARVVDAAHSGGSIKKRIFYWARRVGERWADLALLGKPVPGGLAVQRRLADRLVFKKLRARTGGRMRFFVSGGAPLVPEISKFFAAAGLRILEGYGLTETSPVIAVNPYERLKIGTVGPALPGVEVRIAEDGEILARGPGIMKGYFNKPDATAEAIDGDGWFHTGDIGELDEDGYLRITDRKKDLIVTAGGKKIAPQPIENRVKTSEFVQNAVMIGDKRKFAIILVVPNRDALEQWAGKRNLDMDSADKFLKLPEVVAKLEREVMVHLRDLARFEMPKKVLVVEEDFTEERGELTPTLKVKRRVVEEHYGDLIESAFVDEPPGDAAPNESADGSG